MSKSILDSLDLLDFEEIMFSEDSDFRDELAAIGIKTTDLSKFEVPSSDKSETYTVRFCGSGDGDPDYCGLWECDCPAGSHGRDCKHVKLIVALSNFFEDNHN